MSARETSPSQSAWNEFAEALKKLGDKLMGPTGARGARERAEGFRYLVRLIGAAEELEFEADRQRPSLNRMFTPTRKFIAEGTDTLYHEAKLDPRLSYEMTVRRGDDLFQADGPALGRARLRQQEIQTCDVRAVAGGVAQAPRASVKDMAPAAWAAGRSKHVVRRNNFKITVQTKTDALVRSSYFANRLAPHIPRPPTILRWKTMVSIA